jgi:hypothetical protein
MAPTALDSRSRLRIIPSSLPNLPYTISRRFFDSQTMGYLHFNTVCDKRFLISCNYPRQSRMLSPGVMDVLANGISSDI